MLRISIGCDHGALELKNFLRDSLIREGYEVIDCGTYSTDSCNYPDFAFKAAEKVADGSADFGIVCCHSGEGVSMCANKVKGIRCGIGYNDEVAHLIREHNHANMIAFGADYTTKEEALNRVHIFLKAEELPGRHQNRVNLISEYENVHMK